MALMRRMIPIHQTLLTVIIFIGFYNVLRVVLAHFDCTSSNQFGLMNLRDHRTALRPWTEEQWQEALTWLLVSRSLGMFRAAGSALCCCAPSIWFSPRAVLSGRSGTSDIV